MADLVIFGTGDFARLAHHYFSEDSEHRVVAFTVDQEYLDSDSFDGLPLVAFELVTERFPPDEYSMFVALGYSHMNQRRAERYAAAKGLGYELPSYVSSRCTFLSSHGVGDNCFIFEDNTIQPFVRIGRDVIMWSGNHIGHDSIIEDHCFISSHVVVSGRVRIRPNCFLGVNSTLRNAITIAPRTLVGAGATIVADTVEGGVYVPPRAVLLDKSSDEVRL